MTREDVLLSLVSAGELEIDDAGAIWRVKKRGGNPGRNFECRPCPRVRAEYATRDGYLLVTTTIRGVKTTASAHRIVWTHRNGPIPDGLTINHKNGIKADNRIENLELATMSEQRVHAVRVLNVKRNQPKGELNPKAQTSAADVARMREMRAGGRMVKDIAAQFGMTAKAVSAICRRRTWTHV